jgi:hypothetical protein
VKTTTYSPPNSHWLHGLCVIREAASVHIGHDIRVPMSAERRI